MFIIIKDCVNKGETWDMSIFMLGIDHNMAPVDVRAQFAFTRKNTGEALHRLKEEAGICGCIILSTCNRLEQIGRASCRERV